MKKSFSLTKTALAVASAALLSLSAQAQSVDQAVLDITGQITANTCVLKMTDGSGTTTENKTINLGSTKSGTGTITPGSVFGASQTIIFTLGNPTPGSTAACAGNPSNSVWNVVLGFEPNNVATVMNKTYVKNQATTGGTNAVVMLSGAKGNTTATQLTLKETMGYAGTTVSPTDQTFTDTNGIKLTAQLAYADDKAATAGIFTATIPLLVLYK